MILTSTTQIKAKYEHFGILKEMARRSGALYNSMVYELDQFYKNTGEYMQLRKLDLHMKTHHENKSYRTLPAQVSQQKVKEFIESYKSFFALLKKKQSNEYSKQISKPKYKKRGHLNALTFAKQSFRIKNDQILLSIPKDLQEKFNTKFANIPLPKNVDPETIKQIKIVAGPNNLKVLIQYESAEVPILDKPVENFASIDLGLNNLCAITSNVSVPLLISGKHIKSINRYFNEEISKEKSRIKKRHNLYSSNRIQILYSNRGNQIQAMLHKIASSVVEYAMMNNIDLMIIGHNKEWKQNINLGRKTNQKFVQIPHSKLIEIIKYKLKLVGIKTVIQEEAYTSKCSYFDSESIKKQMTYKGNRSKRGLFITGSNIKINADVNGSLNIARKYIMKFKNVFCDVAMQPVDIGLVMNPVKWKLFSSLSKDSINKFLLTLQIKSVKLLNKFNNLNAI